MRKISPKWMVVANAGELSDNPAGLDSSDRWVVTIYTLLATVYTPNVKIILHFRLFDDLANKQIRLSVSVPTNS
jgi:hypothetical protein